MYEPRDFRRCPRAPQQGRSLAHRPKSYLIPSKSFLHPPFLQGSLRSPLLDHTHRPFADGPCLSRTYRHISTQLNLPYHRRPDDNLVITVRTNISHPIILLRHVERHHVDRSSYTQASPLPTPPIAPSLDPLAGLRFIIAHIRPHPYHRPLPLAEPRTHSTRNSFPPHPAPQPSQAVKAEVTMGLPNDSYKMKRVIIPRQMAHQRTNSMIASGRIARDGSISRRPAWRRPSTRWIYPFAIGATLAMGMGSAPRSEIYINLACLAHPPAQPSTHGIALLICTTSRF